MVEVPAWLFATALLLGPLGVLAGVPLGAWIAFRTRIGKSPMPSLPSLKSLVEVFRRSKDDSLDPDRRPSLKDRLPKITA